MSKPRYDWWPYVKGMIRRYPRLRQEYQELHNIAMVASYSGMPHVGGVSRTCESVAVRELPRNSQREYEAVRRAVELTERYKNGRDRLYVIDLVLWKGSHTLEGAALMVPCHFNTAQKWHGEFIKLAAGHYGFLD